MFTPHKQGDTTVVDAYNQMVSRVKYSLENAEAQAIPSLQKAMQQAVHDINDSIEYLVEYSRDFSGWLLLDIEPIKHALNLISLHAPIILFIFLLRTSSVSICKITD